MYRRLPRITLLAVLCAALVVASWLLLPTPSEHATRSGTPVPGEAAGDGSPYPAAERTGRVSRNSRVKPAPTTPKPSPTKASPVLTGDAALEATVIDLVNAERAAAGCGAVRLEERLRTASRGHSADMAAHEEMSHTGSDGSSPWDRAERAGYDQAMSENIAVGYRTAEAVMEGWMNSRGHRENILNCEAKAVGVGLARAADGTPYWTQMFGRI